ncbi:MULTISPECIES: penicillin-binding protein 1C [unclassified Methylophilus]|uniref:penicillin-binding protein 1C n=1 Tax=unclassified Methylophilus TaxID=2630143 RepID=UPI000AA44049|nr:MULTISPECIES: penicillin-binding protein 1C [unclassified Methylophilus]
MTRKRILLATMTILVIVASAWVFLAPVPSFEQARSATRSSEAVLLDRDGQVLQRLRLDKQRRMLAWVPLQDISPTLQQAVLVAEDKRFYSHSGVDLMAAGSAVLDNLHRSRARGASTISMQLAKLLNAPADGSSQNSWLSKLNQIRYALALELHWSKPQILEAYLNRVTFRGELVGVDAAARGLLAKGPNGLDNIDAAILASLIKSPGASRSRLAKRACATLQTMSFFTGNKSKPDSCMQVTLRTALLPSRPFPIAGMDDAPHLARHLLNKNGEQLKSSIDASVQRFARNTLHTHLAQLADQNVEDGAVVVLDNLSGEVLAYVGSSGDLSGASEVDGVAALRQPGSTLKPFLYALAMDQGWLNASSVLDDSPLALTTPSGLYIPQDYDRHFQGAISVRTALGASLNVPAIRTLTLVGVDPFLDKLRKLGLSSLTRDADHYGFGLALGGAETTLLQLTNAYRALANGGLWQAVSFIPASTSTVEGESRQVFSPQASFIIGDILSDPGARTITFGLSSPLSTRTWAAVKTGTSKAMRDNWAIGYTDRYTVGVWVGNFSGAPMWDVSGITGAAPVWRDIVEYLHQKQHSQQPTPPDGLLHQQVRYQPPIESPRQEWVIADNRITQVVSNQIININVTPASAMLIAPPDSAIIAPDPDIPQQRQALLLQSGGTGKSCMFLDNRPVAACGRTKALVPLPMPGKHELVLTDPHNSILDKHVFEVRGLNVRPSKSH